MSAQLLINLAFIGGEHNVMTALFLNIMIILIAAFTIVVFSAVLCWKIFTLNPTPLFCDNHDYIISSEENLQVFLECNMNRKINTIERIATYTQRLTQMQKMHKI